MQVECRTQEEAEEAIEAGADIVMLDNFAPEPLHKTAALLKKKSPHTLIEGSGGITLDTLPHYMHPAVDVLSMGSLTQGYGFLDFSLKIQQD